MKLSAKVLPLLSIAVLGFILVTGCSDDDNNTTGPNNENGTPIKMDIKPTDFYFYYNRWELDANNNKVGSPVEWRGWFKTNSGLSLSGYTDWYYFRLDDPYPPNNVYREIKVRTDQQSNLYMYGFQHDLFTQFFDLLKTFDANLVVPSIGNEKWDPIAMFNDASGNAKPKNTEWLITDANIEPFNFSLNIGGFPVQITILPQIKGIYEGQGDPVNANGKEVKVWNTKVVATMNVSSLVYNDQIIVTQNVSYSDNPSGQIIFKRGSITITLAAISQSYTQPGEILELKRFQDL